MSDAFDSRAREKMGAYRAPVEGPTLGDSFVIGVGTEVDEYASYSRRLNMSGAYEDRNSTILEWNKTGALPNNFWQEHRAANPYDPDEMNWGAMAFKLKQMGFDIQTDNEIELEVGKKLEQRQINYANPIRQRQGAMGTAAEFAGGLTVAATDPLMWPTYFFGVGAASKTLGLTNRMFRAAKAGAVIGAGSQAALEPFIHNWKEIRGVPYTLNDSLLNIGAAGVLGGTLDGLIVGLGHAITNAKKSGLKPKDIDDMVETLEQVRDEANMAPKDMDPKAALKAVEVEHEYHATRQTEAPVPEALERLDYVKEIPPLPTPESVKGNAPRGEVKETKAAGWSDKNWFDTDLKRISDEQLHSELAHLKANKGSDYKIEALNEELKLRTETVEEAAARMQEAIDDGINPYGVTTPDQQQAIRRGEYGHDPDDMFDFHESLVTSEKVDASELEGLTGARGEFEYGDLEAQGMLGNMKELDQADVDELAKSMKDKGYDGVPIDIGYYPNGEIRILDGNHRARAAIKVGLTDVPVNKHYFAGAEKLGEAAPEVKVEKSTMPEGLAESDIILDSNGVDGVITLGEAVRKDERNLELLETLRGCISGN